MGQLEYREYIDSKATVLLPIEVLHVESRSRADPEGMATINLLFRRGYNYIVNNYIQFWKVFK